MKKTIVTDERILAAIRAGNITLKALTIELGLSNSSATGLRLRRMVDAGKLKKVSAHITYEIVGDRPQAYFSAVHDREPML